MPDKNVPKDILNVVKNKTGKNVSEKEISKLANGVTPSTMKSETQLRQLIKQVAGLVNAPVSEETIQDIINAVKSSNINPNNLEQLMKLLKR